MTPADPAEIDLEPIKKCWQYKESPHHDIVALICAVEALRRRVADLVAGALERARATDRMNDLPSKLRDEHGDCTCTLGPLAADEIERVLKINQPLSNQELQWAIVHTVGLMSAAGAEAVRYEPLHDHLKALLRSQAARAAAAETESPPAPGTPALPSSSHFAPHSPYLWF